MYDALCSIRLCRLRQRIREQMEQSKRLMGLPGNKSRNYFLSCLHYLTAPPAWMCYTLLFYCMLKEILRIWDFYIILRR
jgi:hypothetical protein